MARRSFKLVKNSESHFESCTVLGKESEVEIKWGDCFTCQEDMSEKLVCRGN